MQRRLEMSKDQVSQLEADISEMNRIHSSEQLNYSKQNNNLNEALLANANTIKSLQNKIHEMEIGILIKYKLIVKIY